MRKIKFKTEYVPLSDDAINRHKDFDQLMAVYVATPKPNWFKRFIQNKWTMFSGGLMTGAIVTSLLWLNHSNTEITQPVSQQTTASQEIQADHPKNAIAIIDSSATAQKNNDDEDVNTSQSHAAGLAKNSSAHEKEAIENSPSVKSSSPVKNVVKSEVAKNPVVTSAVAKNVAEATTKTAQEPAIENTALSTAIVNESSPSLNTPQNQNSVQQNNADSSGKNEDANTALQNKLPETEQEKSIDSSVEKNVTTAISNQPEESDSLSQSSIAQEEKTKSNQSSEVLNAAPLTLPLVGSADDPSAKSKKDKKTKNTDETSMNDAEKSAKTAEEKPAPDSSSHAFLNLKWHLFDKDSTKQDSAKEVKKGLFAFLKDTADRKNPEPNLSSDSLYIPRYAQVSFVTPLSSNGIDGYKYMHYVSLNVLQGYSGALRGAEFGGLLNGDKGYVTGAQFAGLANYAGGDLKGAQFAGLANVGATVKGAQFAGITNVSGGFVTGFQAAGVANFSPDSLNGMQVAGVVNIVSSEKKSNGWQVAGVGNVVVANSTGGQIAGVFNMANSLHGGQIGLFNMAKNIKGFQIGLINISDSISGVPIGLISVSAHGIFDADVWTSDILSFNGGVRVGSKYVYNIYAYGVSPFKDELPFGLGIGIGGHIPVKTNGFVDIDGMVWTMHRSYFSFYGVNIINQLRVMGGYRFNKYISVFAGPTFNVGVQDSRYDPFHSSSFYEHDNGTTTVYMWPGFVAGIRLF